MVDRHRPVAPICQSTPHLIVGCLTRRLLMIGAVNEDTGARDVVACKIEVRLRREVCFRSVLGLGWQVVAMFVEELEEAPLMWGCRVADAQKPVILLLPRPAVYWF